ncbi:intraflagellar transport protein 140 homolog [Patella vulgata]|uniref:intraflagellar transport protein 140 homolog n=1 Tax=Patella vulgata TaxID=6465 RepID=UPI0024A8E361|nr:intraflagellar transport protein 140 homolog [Patella vulgata]XP_050392807.2 intraflagellar transport protein 140 homolog [Patella vulgata]
MAVYFDHRLDCDSNFIKTDISWSPSSLLLAITCYSDENGGAVQLFTEEGEKIEHSAVQKHCHVSVVAWHPTKRIIAVGWDTGEITIWNEQDHEVSDAVHIHKKEVSILHWSTNGSRLSSGDKGGVLHVWKSDSKGRLQQNPMCQHHIQESLTAILYRPPTIGGDPSADISSLARAAVSGDESALDMFNWKRSKNSKLQSFGPSESLAFFIGGGNGGVYYVNENGQCTQSFCLDASIKELLFYEERSILVTVTSQLQMTQHAVLPDGGTQEVLKAKLSGKSGGLSVLWAGKGLLATASGEMVVRMWDLASEDNYVLNLDSSNSYDANETIICISYCHEKGTLAGGTNMGNIALWKYSPSLGKEGDAESMWKLQSPPVVDGQITQVQWAPNKGFIAANTVANVFMLSEQVMSASFRDETAVVQYGPSSLAIEIFSTGNNHDIKVDIQIKGAYTTKDALAIWNGKRVIIYEYAADRSVIRATGSFVTETMVICLYEQNVYTIEQNKVQVRTFQGTVKQVLSFIDMEGVPICLDICGNYLVVATDVGVVRVYDLSRREAKAHSNAKALADLIPGFGTVISAKCNCTGNRVSVLVQKGVDNSIDPKLYFWDVETDSVQYFNFESGRGEQDDYLGPKNGEELDEDINDAERGKNQASKDIAGRYPISHYWDMMEPKLVVCEAKYVPVKITKDSSLFKRSISLNKSDDDCPVEKMIVSLFCTPENGLLIQDSFPLSIQHNSLIGIEVPHLYFVQNPETLEDENQQSDNGEDMPIYPKLVARRIMRDFVGLESSDKSTRDAMMNFSYYLTIGNMDEAFKAIKLIKSESVWENMAKMCVKSRRLDVATVCLGNMGNARGAKALRESAKEPELDARVAVLAIQLGLYEDAERLLKNCKRYDLLNEFYQNSGQWEKAQETAEKYDRIHLRTTNYNFAKHLEDIGETALAVQNYEKSGTQRFEVPRMFGDDPDILEQYIINSKDKKLRKWWAQYLESTSDMKTALQFYESAQDYFSVVRVYCYCEEMAKAAEICNETGDAAACYYLARQYENQGQIREAIHFFSRAKAFGSAIRLCKEHDIEDQLLNLALLGRPEDMMEAARYYEQKPGSQDKAVMLYHKAGNFSKATDLAFKNKEFGALQHISGDLDERADPELLRRCGDFFLENGQYDKAVDLLALAKKYWDALKICMEKHVEMTEELCEKLSPEKDENENNPQERLKILEAVAEVCMHQGQYHIATKKYTQAGNKLKAMKALLKSGDTEKIVFFAGVSRQREIYVMAANYLQSLDWRKDPEIMKNIIGFYSKGRALDSLAGFYDACAQVEIDEYQNYDKALGALGEAYKCMSKAKLADESLQEERMAQIKHKITVIKKFVLARKAYEDDPEDAIKQCQVILAETDQEGSLRLGDVYGFMIEHYAKKERWKAAYSTLEELKSKMPVVNPAYYVEMKTIEAIHRALDIPLSRTINTDRLNGFRKSPEEEDGEILDEEVAEELVNGV